MSGSWCATVATPSMHTIAPTACALAVMARASFSEPTILDTWGKQTSLVRGPSSASRASRSRSPLSGSTRHSRTTTPLSARRRQAPPLASWS